METGEKTFFRKDTKTNFRELAPEQFWRGSVDLQKIGDEDLSTALSEIASGLQFTYSGYRGDSKYHFSRYPRRKFGPVAPVEQYQTALRKLGDRLRTPIKEEAKSEQPVVRVLLGLQEGYNKETKLHTAQEVEIELGHDITIKPVEIYSVGPWGKYQEPAVVVECDPTDLQKIYDLAEKFHQARFAVEDLHAGTARMVETKYCTDPDEE